jgi:dynein heavy chain 1
MNASLIMGSCSKMIYPFSFQGYEHVRKLLQSYAKVNVLIVELKSDALKERHWKQICRELRVNWVLSDLVLGQVCQPTLPSSRHLTQ